MWLVCVRATLNGISSPSSFYFYFYVEITCPQPTAPSHGGVQNGGVSYRSVATYTCDQGYHISGSTQRTCQISGDWDGTQPTCTREYHVTLIHVSTSFREKWTWGHGLGWVGEVTENSSHDVVFTQINLRQWWIQDFPGGVKPRGGGHQPMILTVFAISVKNSNSGFYHTLAI